RNKLALSQRLKNRIRRLFDVLKIRVFLRGERGWHADDNAIGFAKPPEVARGFEPLFIDQRLHARPGNMSNVRFAGIQFADFLWINIKSDDGEPFFSKAQHKRQPDISKSYDSDAGIVILDVLDEFVFDAHKKNLPKKRFAFEDPNGMGGRSTRPSPSIT